MAPNRFFAGCTALLAAAKGSAAATAAATPELVSVLKVVPVSPALGEFLGLPESPEASRTHTIRTMWAYIVANKLQDPVDVGIIHCDDKLKPLFEGKDRVKLLDIPKLLTEAGHFKESFN
ncbi:upstream activation factor subunit spp27-like isoform X2 [Cornus florida]|uniref:upstream activation factor subunit spp27-like isoform X2 n=1 Tax=Cornus florida TaxID=4283 RepID=UPI0028A0A608|nr:upstream activation factor subunit spp27-like isoform X2 [Cornus florida]